MAFPRTRRERFIHVGDERRRLEARHRSHGDEAFGPITARFLHRRHEGPEPHLTSSTRCSRPAASFFDRIVAVMSGMDSTVAVTSRMPLSRFVGGGQIGGWPMMAQPASRVTLPEQVEARLRDVARNEIELVERAAGVAEAAA